MKAKQKTILGFSSLIVLLFIVLVVISLDPWSLVPGNGGGVEPPVFYDSLPSAPILYDIQPDPDLDVSVSLDWSDSSSVWYYNVYRYKSGEAEQSIALARTDSSFVDSVFKEDGLYYYRIEAVNNIGKVQSNTKTVTINVPLDPTPTIPDSPILLLAVNNPSTDGEIRLEWDVVYGADRYAVYRTKEECALELLGEIDVNHYEDSVSDNGVYYYKIKAININDESSDYSNEISIIVQIAGMPESPLMNLLTYNVINKTIEIYLDWDDVICESYNIYKSVDNGAYILIEGGLTSTSYSEVLTEVGLYAYRVSAVNEHGESELSNPSSIAIGGDGERIGDLALVYLVIISIVIIGSIITIILVKKKKRRSQMSLRTRL